MGSSHSKEQKSAKTGEGTTVMARVEGDGPVGSPHDALEKGVRRYVIFFLHNFLRFLCYRLFSGRKRWSKLPTRYRGDDFLAILQNL
jgi:hypothetical protein